MTTEQLIPLAVLPVVLVILWLRNRRPRSLHVRWMWVAPLIVSLAVGFGLWGAAQTTPDAAPFGVGEGLILIVGLALGVAAGWWRGKGVTITRRTDGSLEAQASPVGMLLIVALLVLRQALRPWMEANADAWHVNPVALQDAFLLFAAGMVVVQRLEMWLRARAILAGKPDAHLETDPG